MEHTGAIKKSSCGAPKETLSEGLIRPISALFLISGKGEKSTSIFLSVGK